MGMWKKMKDWWMGYDSGNDEEEQCDFFNDEPIKKENKEKFNELEDLNLTEDEKEKEVK